MWEGCWNRQGGVCCKVAVPETSVPMGSFDHPSGPVQRAGKAPSISLSPFLAPSEEASPGIVFTFVENQTLRALGPAPGGNVGIGVSEGL